jgi:hypothetical protein
MLNRTVGVHVQRESLPNWNRGPLASARALARSAGISPWSQTALARIGLGYKRNFQTHCQFTWNGTVVKEIARTRSFNPSLG